MRELEAYDQDFGTKSKEDQNWPLALTWTILTLRGYLKEGSSGDGQGQRFVNSLSQVELRRMLMVSKVSLQRRWCLLWGGSPVERNWVNHDRVNMGEGLIT